MENTNHTPGPWRASGLDVMGSDRSRVATVLPWDDSGQGQEDLANTKLIAAAPEMLRIIQRLAKADWIGEAELNLWRKECREILSKTD